MAALTENYDAEKQKGEVIAYAVGANKEIFKGALVVTDDTTGYAETASDSAGKTFVGVAYERADNNPGSAGALTCRVQKSGTYVYNWSGTHGQALVGDPAYIVDDNTVGAAGAATNDILCGYVVGIPATGKVRIRIDAAVR
jgi:hypothetical protein